MKKVIIYPGRFQPMLPHHAQVYNTLVANNPTADVYIATSDKVEADKSPFDFSEKKMIMVRAHGIDPEKILQVRSPYSGKEYEKYFDPDSTVLMFAVGEKDMQDDPRFEMRPDPDTGLNLKRNGEPSWMQLINTNSETLLPFSQRGYLVVAPTVTVQGKTASATAFRNAIKSAVDQEHAKQEFRKFFGTFDKAVFDRIYKKLEEQIMYDQINELRKLAGLPLLEGAPVHFSISDTQRKLAEIGRMLMNVARDETDDKFSGAISELGGQLADGDISTVDDLEDFMKDLDDTETASKIAKIVTDVFARYNAGERAELVGDEPTEDSMNNFDESQDDTDIMRKYLDLSNFSGNQQ